MLELGLQHVAVVAIAVSLSSLIGISLGIAVYRSRRAREIVLAAAGITLTIPSFALFVLFIGPFGLGAVPVVLALTLYGLLPILRNTIAGLRAVDPSVVESARAMGMSRSRQLITIELPLAWPVIITGIRVTTLILIGIAAIGNVVLGPGYGELIFTGLARVGTPVGVNLVLAGIIGVMIVAVLYDLAFNLLRVLTTSRGIR
jgi:osmoprotectant transport system permease protein